RRLVQPGRHRVGAVDHPADRRFPLPSAVRAEWPDARESRDSGARKERREGVSDTVETPVYRFAVVGAGWRTLFYLRVVAALGERFQLTGVVTRSQARAEEVKAAWGVDASPRLDGLLDKGRLDFVVLSVPRVATVEWLETLTSAGLPVLCETPPALDLAGLHRVSA